MIISLDETKTLYEFKRDLKSLQYVVDAGAVRIKAEEEKLERLRRSHNEDIKRRDKCQEIIIKHKDNRHE